VREVAVLYLEHTPAAPLIGFIRILWYAQVGEATHRRERVLPSGCVQVILNLARDFLLDCPEGEGNLRMPPSLVVGARSVYEIVDSSDMADLIGIVFEPGGFAPFARDAVDLFSNRSVSLEDAWGLQARSLRDRLRELCTPQARLRFLENFLTDHFAPRLTRHGPWRSGEVKLALQTFDHSPGIATVREMAKQTGRSERRFSQIFRQEVGLSPKTWCRVQRFQRAVRLLHAGSDVRWAELALDCGFYDQSHFANEFRAFSGIDATTYSARRTQWANHVAAE
jgi:AraC-like DNA-binding protein